MRQRLSVACCFFVARMTHILSPSSIAPQDHRQAAHNVGRFAALLGLRVWLNQRMTNLPNNILPIRTASGESRMSRALPK
jgi:hypothetical protein